MDKFKLKIGGIFNPLKLFFPKKMVGIDIGTDSLKVVEISRSGNGRTLENYAQVLSSSFDKESFLSGQEGNHLLSDEVIPRALKAVLAESRIKTKAAIFSIPDFYTFCTSFEIPPMVEKEIPNAIRYNASQYVTLPISEVTLDWQVTPVTPGDKTSSLRVFLIAVPNQVVQEYQTMARMADLEIYALETEVLGITRSLIKNNKKTVCLVDIGVQSSTINIVDKGFLKKSYSFNFNSGQLARIVSSVLGVDLEKAEQIKNKEGLLYGRQDMVKTLYLLMDPLLIELKSVCAEFLQSEQRQVDEVYLTGGTANLPGLREYFAASLKKNVYIPNCFSEFLYPPILEESLRAMSPSFSAAVGVALGGLDR